MAARERVVLDTGVLISRLLVPGSVPGQVVRHVVRKGLLLASEATVGELAEVLSRSKLDPYLTVTERQELVRLVGRIVERVTIVHTVRACRDPKDDKFLELAVNGQADVVVTGDEDLLVLDPFRGIPIVSPRRYLAERARLGDESLPDPVEEP